MLVDVHTHIIPEKLPDFTKRVGGDRWPRLDFLDACTAKVMIAGENFRTITDQCWNASRRLDDMQHEGVERQVISPTPKLFSYWFEPADTRDFSRYINEFIAEMVRAHPQRFYGLGQVPLQDPEMAAAELSEIKRLGLHGVEIGTNVDGRSLADPMFLPFFAECEKQDIPLFVHALDPFGTERFIGSSYLHNLIGFPQENQLAAATLITGGVIEKHPNLRILFSHGGSGFAIVLSRLDQGWRTMEQFTPRPPSAYVDNFYFDTLLFDPVPIRFLVEKFGADHLMVGSDYPFVIREVPPGKYLREVTGLTAQQQAAIHGENCLRFLGVDKA